MRRFAVLLTVLFLAAGGGVPAQQPQPAGGIVRGRVADATGAVVVGADVAAVGTDQGGAERRTQTNQSGEFSFNLPPGKYTIRVTSPGFALYENSQVEVASGHALSLDVELSVGIQETQVTVADEAGVSADPEASAGAVVLRGTDIESLPDNPEELDAALRALAGPGAGPNGGEIFIDGFSGGRLPPRDTIREIRINQNPFSSEFDRLGFGRIEILTKPGTDDFRGEFEFEFEDESLNSRNPFAANRAPFQVRAFSGNFAGPLVRKRASFFVDFEHETADENSLINALVLAPDLSAVPFQLAVPVPSRGVEFSPRLDFQINQNNTLVARYFFSRENSENAGLGGFDLLSRAYRTRGADHTFRLTETAVISGSVINEARFQYIRRRGAEESEDGSPTIRVLDAFTAGGANVGLAFSNEDRLELQNNTSFVLGDHSLKVGGRLRHVRLDTSSPGNFAGTFTFTSLELYRNTILDQGGARPTQFTLAGGDPRAAITQTDAGLFIQDDWRARPGLTLSFGLRYEAQTNVSNNLNFAPRLAFAYAPGAAGGNSRPKTVFRGGFGVFYERFGESLGLQAVRFNGVNQRQFVVTDPAILDQVIFTREGGVLNVPTVEALSAFAQPQTTRVVSPDLSSPYTMQTAFSVERQLPLKSTFSATYINARTRRLLRSRNINAPLPGGARPVPAAGNIFQYESTGRFDQNQLVLNFRSNFLDDVSVFANYSFGKARSDSDGAGTFPADSYDLTGEYGDASLDVRHRFVVGGSFPAPFGFRLNPFITYRSGVPFNITTGADANGDSVFTERPAFATNPSEPGVISTRFGVFDPTPESGGRIIPRNFGRGPNFFVTNLRVSKEFGFGGNDRDSSAASTAAAPAAQGGRSGGGGNRGGMGGPFGGGGGNRGGGGRDDDESRFRVEFSVQIRNLFNRTNRGTPVGNLRSPFFGESVSTAGGFGFGGGGGGGAAGNRRVEFEIQFSF